MLFRLLGLRRKTNLSWLKKKEDIFLQHVKDVRIPQGPQGRMSQGLWGRGESQEQEDSLAVSSVCLSASVCESLYVSALLCLSVCLWVYLFLSVDLCLCLCVSLSVSVFFPLCLCVSAGLSVCLRSPAPPPGFAPPGFLGSSRVYSTMCSWHFSALARFPRQAPASYDPCRGVCCHHGWLPA